MGAPLIGISDGLVRFDSFQLAIPRLWLEPGIYWLTGPNGSGKTTLLRVLLSLQPLSEGRFEAPTGGSRGYLPQNFRDSLFPWLTARENLHLLGGPAEFLDGWTRRLGLTDSELPRRAYHLSGGQAQRMALVRECALLPDLLILDEPFSALDLKAGEAAGQMLVEVKRASGGTIVFTNHGALPPSLLEAEIRSIEVSRVSDERAQVSQP